MNVLSLFDGMSCGRIALERAGVQVDKYYASELDKYAIKVSKHNWDDIEHLGDITRWKDWDIDWSKIDLLIGGSPCQGFSFAGKQLAFDDPRSKLFFVFVDILNHIKKQKPDVKFMLENVNMKKQFLNVITEHLGVEPVRINTNLILPVKRDRLYWANWEIDPVDTTDRKNVSELPGIGAYQPATVKRTKNGNFVVFTEVFGALTTKCGDPNGIGRPSLSLKEFEFGSKFPKDGVCKPLTPEQCEWLQSVPLGYTACVSNNQRYKMLGNGWTIDIIAHILRGISGK
jgi:DNA (cytosine-5)-methyltransferase 3A